MKKASCARAYLEGGCKTCNSLYIELRNESKSISEDFVGKTRAFRLRKGCRLSLYPDIDHAGRVETVTSETVEVKTVYFNIPSVWFLCNIQLFLFLQDYTGSFRSYRCSCNDREYEPRKRPPRPSTSKQMPINWNSCLNSK